MAAAAPRISYKGLPGTEIEIVPPTSQEFMDALKLSADPQALSVIQPILPYSVMIKNGSPQRLLMVTIQTRLVDAAGKAMVRYVTQGTRNNSPADMIAPGSMVFLTPVGGLNTVLPRLGTMHIVEADRLAARIAKLLSLFSQESDIEIVMDSAVFDDGGLIGPDIHRTLEMVNSWADAEDSVIRGVLACIMHEAVRSSRVAMKSGW